MVVLGGGFATLLVFAALCHFNRVAMAVAGSERIMEQYALSPAAMGSVYSVFLLAYTPCVATLAAQRREIGMRWTTFGVSMPLPVPWVAAVAHFQTGSRLCGAP